MTFLESAWEPLCRIFYSRSNEALEWSRLKISLEAAGIRASHFNDWGSLAATLKSDGLIEEVGREPAVTESRNHARNGVYRLTPWTWTFVETFLAPSRGWKKVVQTKDAEQTELVGER